MEERAVEIQGRSTGPAHGGDGNCLGRLREEFRVKNFGLNHPNPQLFVSCQWGNYPTFYLVWRLFWALFHLGWIVCNWVDDALYSEQHGTWLIYLTNWGYFILTFDTVILALLQIYVTYARKEFIAMPWYVKACWVTYTLASVAALLITVLNYALLFEGDWKLLNTITHMINSVYVILDLAVTAIPVRLFHVIYFHIFSFLYLVFSVIYWAAGGKNDDGASYIYKPLNYNEPAKAAPLAVGVVLFGVPLTHLVFWLLYQIRMALFGCVKGSKSVGGGGGGGGGGKNDNLEMTPI